MAVDPWSAGLQLVGMATQRGGGSQPIASSSDGNFAYQTMLTGMPGWNVNLGGDGPPQVRAFSERPDSLVMGMTGLSTTTGKAAGNGLSVGQPSAMTNSLAMLALVGLGGFVLAWALKGRK